MIGYGFLTLPPESSVGSGAMGFSPLLHLSISKDVGSLGCAAVSPRYLYPLRLYI